MRLKTNKFKMITTLLLLFSFILIIPNAPVQARKMNIRRCYISTSSVSKNKIFHMEKNELRTLLKKMKKEKNSLNKDIKSKKAEMKHIKKKIVSNDKAVIRLEKKIEELEELKATDEANDNNDKEDLKTLNDQLYKLRYKQIQLKAYKKILSKDIIRERNDVKLWNKYISYAKRRL